jgi:hypothetical protein
MASENRGARAVPREYLSTALVVDAGRASGMSPRFHNLVITSHREWLPCAETIREGVVIPDLAA